MDKSVNDEQLLAYAKETMAIEIAEAQRMLCRLDNSLVVACKIILNCIGKVIVSGIGKSGHIGKKIAASLASTGTPSFFVHPAEALHGDLGMIGNQDVVIFISYSGRVSEFDTLMPLLTESSIPVIALTGNITSPLAKSAVCVLNICIEREACPMELAPTSSAVNTLIMGDAIAMTLMRQRGFSIEQFARSHPGGTLGVQLLSRVHHVMRSGDQVAKVSCQVTVMDAMFELSRTGLGLTAVCDVHGYVIGVFTDGDLRRWLVQGRSLDDPIFKAMTSPGYQLLDSLRAKNAVEILHKYKITAAPVVDIDGLLVGAINMHDLHQAGIKQYD
ncbi:arabinose-5-phosphate isomerase GutQ [Blochmannia endosymbiont of Camponotus (Colobopsis) obliquus]|uniref:arabinose-5-phosphate isomerase GutQ n=1 Tax=Blochmannia endosymbiont of Camponotus (Colobopsis) obliquus TaxID=1505597 RepID=UPI00061A5F55|nr:arabinose-5-phosphate isomerase GutQ [Blochmannia endosymbiont of Camponotus (Colobopsis) obliquus]AKC60611.1 arabinose 5-phosphate isomerase GutQ [Blochmannia endosymbiont of Camponotus (Colobopsis) obliquus]